MRAEDSVCSALSKLCQGRIRDAKTWRKALVDGQEAWGRRESSFLRLSRVLALVGSLELATALVVRFRASHLERAPGIQFKVRLNILRAPSRFVSSTLSSSSSLTPFTTATWHVVPIVAVSTVGETPGQFPFPAQLSALSWGDNVAQQDCRVNAANATPALDRQPLISADQRRLLLPRTTSQGLANSRSFDLHTLSALFGRDSCEARFCICRVPLKSATVSS